MQNKNQIVELVEAAMAGQGYAFRALYDRFSKTVYNICLRMTGNSEDAEDIVQEAFITAFQKLNELRDREWFGAWLRKIVVNACIRQSKTRVSFAQLSSEFDADNHSPDDWPDETSFSSLHHAIKSLPDGCRQILLLYVMEDYSHREIAAALNISESTSKSQYARAKKLLKQQLIVHHGQL